MRIPSGVVDQYLYFVAVDSTDLKTRETGLTSFTVYRSRNGAAAAAMTTPTVAEVDSANMPGVYTLLMDEDMTIGAGNDTEEMVFHITQAAMTPVTRTIELYRPKITVGNTLDVTATGAAGIDWGNVENASTTVDLSATSINLCDTVTTNTDMRGTDNALLAASAPTNFGDLAITATTGKVTIGTNDDKTGYSLTQSFPTNFADLAITATTGKVTVGTNDDKTGYSISGTKTTLDALNDVAATDIVSAGAITTLSGAVVNVDTVDTCTTNTDMVSEPPTAAAVADAVWDEATTGHVTAGTFGEQVKTDIDAILADTNELQTDDVPGLIAALNDPTAAAVADAVWDEATTGHTTAGTFGEQVKTDIDAILTDTGTTLPATLAGLNDVSVSDILTTQMTESYAADGTAPTLAQALFLIQQMLAEKSISSTTLTVKKLDGSTTAATFTLNDDTSPTSITRST